MRARRILGVALVACLLSAPSASADELHPMLDSKYWVKAGAFFASRDIGLSVNGSAGGASAGIDFESETGLDDSSDLFIAEFGWQFAKKWDFAFQHFRSSRVASAELTDTIEWGDVTYEAGLAVDVQSEMRITRLFFARRFWDKGPHDLRLGAGVHWLDTSISIRGVATLPDGSQEFQANVVSAAFPFPNIGAWYRYSLSERWVLHTRADWLSASASGFSGGIWDVSAGVDYSISKHLGIGIAYQFFQIDGGIKEDDWQGHLYSRYEGFTVSIDGFW